MNVIKKSLALTAITVAVVLAIGGCSSTSSSTPPPVGSSTLTILTTKMPAATVGTAYTQIFQAGFNTGTETWTFTGLPSWLAQSLGDEITGTPKAAGTYNFTATVTDAAGHIATQSMSIVAS